MGRRGNGEWSITRHKKSGLYMARYWVETPQGPKRKTIYAKTRQEVADELAKVLAARADSIVYDDENMTVGEYLDKWLKGSVRGSVRQSTHRRIRVRVRSPSSTPRGQRRELRRSAWLFAPRRQPLPGS
jgi:integrase